MIAISLNVDIWIIIFSGDHDPENYDVVVGDWHRTVDEGTEEEMSISDIHIYPSYDEEYYDFDIAVVELDHGVELDDYVSPISLPPR